MDYFNKNKDLEEAMLKTSLLFSTKKLGDKRDSLFLKSILSLVISRKVNTISDIKEYFFRENNGLTIDEAKLNNTIKEFKEKGLIDVNGDVIFLTEKAAKDCAEYIDSITEKMNALINDIIVNVKNKNNVKQKGNDEQCTRFIKDCFNYYFEINGISFFELDAKKDIKKLELESLISKHEAVLGKEYIEQVVYYIGSIINNPSDEHEEVLKILARNQITTQIMGIDPLLSSFKATKIRDKVFIVDTEVVLYAITENAHSSCQYRMMLSQLIQCQCKLYIPDEVISEVYDHAEASIKRYSHVENIIDNYEDWVPNQLKNVFVEDYYYSKKKSNGNFISWDTYISNYFDRRIGVPFILAQIKEKLGDGINYAEIPEVEIDMEEKAQLEEEALRETKNTEKAQFREDEKNVKIAKNDTCLYLTTRNLNVMHNIDSSSISNGLLRQRYYLLSEMTRIHYCAKRKNMSANVICNPKALMAYLAETGILNKKQVDAISLFDNPFLLYTAKNVWDDVKVLLDNGVDIKGRNLVRMRYDLEEEIHVFLTTPSVEDRVQNYNQITKKGYRYDDLLDTVYQENNDANAQIAKLREELERKNKEVLELQQNFDKAQKTIDNQNKIINKDKYLNRKKQKDKSILKKKKH